MESFNCLYFNLLTKKKLYPIETGNFKLDGGNVWGCTQDNLSRTNPADANNLIDIAARCLLLKMVTDLLIDTGMGNKQSENFLVIIPGHIHG
jgi:hypothetical protein